MTITSSMFLLFILIGVVLYYTVLNKFQWELLLLMSIVFIGSYSISSIIVVILSSCVAYVVALAVHKQNNLNKKKKLISVGVLSTLAILVWLKYILGEIDSLVCISDSFNGNFGTFVKKYIIPIGLSYFTLQLISYLLDVYWERIEPEKNYFKILLFTCFFPQLLQGPISKYAELSKVLFKSHNFSIKNIKFGSQLYLYGLFKKVVIADTVGKYIDIIFWNDIEYTGLMALLGLVLYGVQLYCDFSGGIDMIRGTAEILDIHLKKNFEQPFFSKSLAEFWRRWHISLGEWMKDYVFNPLSLSELVSKIKKIVKNKYDRKMANKIAIVIGDLVVFILVGIWHGTGTNYLGWGLYNGIILSTTVLFEDNYKKIKNKLGINIEAKSWHYYCVLRTFVIVTIGWIFDCSFTATGAIKIFANLFKISGTLMVVSRVMRKI